MEGFVKISKYAGMREDLVQAGGGNSSCKLEGNKMVIKASGFQLADVTDTSGYAIVDARKIRDAFLYAENLDKMTEAESKKILEEAFVEGARPSIETFLHAISGKYTLHTHSIVVNALTCRKNWKDELTVLFKEALYVPYATPGVELAKAFFEAYKEYGIDKTPEIVFLQNHGLVVSANTADDVIAKTEEVVKTIEDYLRCDFSSYHNLTDIWKLFPDKIVWQVTDKNVLDMFLQENKLWDYTFCPDCVVFLGKKALVLPDRLSKAYVETFREKYGTPVIVQYQKDLYILADNVKKAMEIQSVMSFSSQVMKYNVEVECNLLSDAEQNFLLNWEAEKYRQSIK